jgi:hypothetical protein
MAISSNQHMVLLSYHGGMMRRKSGLGSKRTAVLSSLVSG